MNSDLKIAYCSYKAAKYAVMNWHYSKSMPSAGLIKYGAWEGERFIGAVIYGKGATPDLVKQYGLNKIQGCELVRVALSVHKSSVTKIISITMKLLKRDNPGLRLVVSFADTEQGHLGVIYQAGNWIYSGKTTSAREYIYKGKRYHGRSFRNIYGSEASKKFAYKIIKGSSKYRYLYPLDKKMRKQIELLRKPYPKKIMRPCCNVSIDSDLESGGGANPTRTLQ